MNSRKTEQKICHYFNVTPEDITGSSRFAYIVNIRLIYIKILFDRFKMDKSSIGKVLNRDRTTIIYLQKNFDDRLEYDRDFREMYNGFMNYLLLDSIQEINGYLEFLGLPCTDENREKLNHILTQL